MGVIIFQFNHPCWTDSELAAAVNRTHTHPGIILAQTALVASGVTSRGAGPVPPVVTTRQQPSRST